METKNQKRDFYRNKKVTEIDDFDDNKILVSKEEPYSTKKSFKCFYKWLAMLENLKVIQQCSLRLATSNC